MHNIWTIAQREYKRYFFSPVAYVVAFFIYLILGVYFFLILYLSTQQTGMIPTMDRIYEFLVTLLLFLVPAITTRLFSEERHLGTIELLLTAPLRDWELVLGKWLGAFMLLVTIVSLTIIYPLILNQIIEPGIDQGSLISQFLGLMLIIGMMIAIGVALSSLFTNQVATFIVTLFTFIFLWVVLAWVTQVMGQFSGGSGWLKYLNIQEPFSSNLVRGIIDLKDVVFYLSITALALFLATMSIEIRRWR